MAFVDDDRTDAERAYFESGGEKTEGLTAPGAPAPAPAPAVPQPAASESKPADSAQTAVPAGEQKPAPQASQQQPAAATDEEGEEIEHGGKKRRMVNFGALHQERERRKALEKLVAEVQATNRDLNEKFARGDERLRLLTEALTPQQQADEAQAQQADPRPDPEKDILGFIAWQDRRAERLEKQLATASKQSTEAADQARSYVAEQQLVTTYRGDAAAFAQKNPDFAAAYQFLLGDRDRELAEMGYADPKQRLALILGEERDLVTRNLQAGKSPAEAIYRLAKGRGFKPPEATTPAAAAAAQAHPAQPAQQPAAGAVAVAAGAPPAAAAAAAQAQPSVTDEIARIKAGQEAAKSLSSAGGTPNAPFSLASLAELSDDDYAKVVAKHGGLAKLIDMAAA